MRAASTERGRDAGAQCSWDRASNLQSFCSFSRTGPGKQSTVFLQLQSNGTRRRMGAAQLGSGQTIYSLSSASIKRDPATQRSLSRTGPGRSTDAALLRLVEAAVQPRPNGTGLLRRCSSVSSNQVRFCSVYSDQAPLRLLYNAAVLNLLSLKRPLVVKPGESTTHPYCDPATLRFFTSEAKRPGTDSILYYRS